MRCDTGDSRSGVAEDDILVRMQAHQAKSRVILALEMKSVHFFETAVICPYHSRR